jgi:hypothetical protein
MYIEQLVCNYWLILPAVAVMGTTVRVTTMSSAVFKCGDKQSSARNYIYV